MNKCQTRGQAISNTTTTFSKGCASHQMRINDRASFGKGGPNLVLKHTPPVYFLLIYLVADGETGAAPFHLEHSGVFSLSNSHGRSRPSALTPALMAFIWDTILSGTSRPGRLHRNFSLIVAPSPSTFWSCLTTFGPGGSMWHTMISLQKSWTFSCSCTPFCCPQVSSSPLFSSGGY